MSKHINKSPIRRSREGAESYDGRRGVDGHERRGEQGFRVGKEYDCVFGVCRRSN